MTAKPVVLVATGDPVELNRWQVAGRSSGISVQVMNDTHETFAGVQREIEAVHSRVHRMNAEVANLTERISRMCQSMLDALGKEEAKTP